MEWLILFDSINLVLSQSTNKADESETQTSKPDTSGSTEKDLNISEKILDILNSEEFLYVFGGLVMLIVVGYAFSLYCRQTPSLEHPTEECDKPPDQSSYKSIRNLRQFFTNTLLNFNNIDEQVAKEHEIKSIDSLTSKNTSKSQSKSRQSNQRPLITLQKSSKSSVFSKSDTNTPIRLKINMIKSEKGSSYLAMKKSKATLFHSSSLSGQ